MDNYENVWSFGTARVRVAFDVAPEDDLDLSWDDDGSVAAGLNSGLYCAFVARVTVDIDGQEAGCSYLGGCIYKNPSDFIGDGYFRDMVREAIGEARRFEASRPEPLRLRAA